MNDLIKNTTGFYENNSIVEFWIVIQINLNDIVHHHQELVACLSNSSEIISQEMLSDWQGRMIKN